MVILTRRKREKEMTFPPNDDGQVFIQTGCVCMFWNTFHYSPFGINKSFSVGNCNSLSLVDQNRERPPGTELDTGNRHSLSLHLHNILSSTKAPSSRCCDWDDCEIVEIMNDSSLALFCGCATFACSFYDMANIQISRAFSNSVELRLFY